ncbi:hypothetical protein A4D02_12785 [Niastella koreensis]|uniref:Uncharacterized protein n=2 Tax=Niastella koreensis TaxID=354356 RepID=G8TKY9_NIAKG|nr:hypothetical protein Niako_4570 [Niastella koreensis GR20-10]OQP42441.1 hypothetical protein A4D02_12785 [Niastella koreensis]
MPDHRKLLLVCVLVLTAILFIDLLLVREYLPEHIPGTPINVFGLFIIVCWEVLFHVVFRRILKQHDYISVLYLTVFACLIVLFSEILFQTYRQLAFDETYTDQDRIRIFLIAVIGMPLFAAALAFPVAVDIKYKKRWLTTMLYAVLGASCYFAMPYVLSFIRGE